MDQSADKNKLAASQGIVDRKKAVDQTDSSENRPFLTRTSIYGLEFAIAMITLLIVLTVLSFGAFVLASYIDSVKGTDMGEFALWSAASTIVWLPVAYIFYMRTRSYTERNPAIVDTSSHRATVMIYQVVTMLTVIAFAFASIYSALNAFVQSEDMGSTLLTVSLPAFISAGLFTAGFVAFFRRPVVSRKTFGTGLLVVSLLIVVPVVTYSMLTLRGASADQTRSSDLELLDQAIKSHYRENRSSLPASLSDLDANTKNNLKKPLDSYSYDKKSSNSFELCTDFDTDTTNGEKIYSTEGYSNYTNYYFHDSGKQCFDDRVATYGTHQYKTNDNEIEN